MTYSRHALSQIDGFPSSESNHKVTALHIARYRADTVNLLPTRDGRGHQEIPALVSNHHGDIFNTILLQGRRDYSSARSKWTNSYLRNVAFHPSIQESDKNDPSSGVKWSKCILLYTEWLLQVSNIIRFYQDPGCTCWERWKLSDWIGRSYSNGPYDKIS